MASHLPVEMLEPDMLYTVEVVGTQHLAEEDPVGVDSFDPVELLQEHWLITESGLAFGFERLDPEGFVTAHRAEKQHLLESSLVAAETVAVMKVDLLGPDLVSLHSREEDMTG